MRVTNGPHQADYTIKVNELKNIISEKAPEEEF